MGEFKSPVKRWPGKIYLPEYLSFPDLLEWEKAMKSLQSGPDGKTQVDMVGLYNHVLPVIMKMVVKWELEGLPEDLTPEKFPGSAELLNWLTNCVTDLFGTTNEIAPNLPEPPSTPPSQDGPSQSS